MLRQSTFLLLSLVVLMSYGCVERVEGPVQETHKPDWNILDSENFHGLYVREQAVFSCTGCHNDNLPGDELIVGCFGCHDGSGGHPVGWVARTQHGAEVDVNGPTDCSDCHGTDYTGGWSAISCYQCHEGGPDGAHAAGWELGSAHGAEVRFGGSSQCTDCHGSDYLGGSSGLSCFQCHDGPGGHPDRWRRPRSHGDYAEANGIAGCADCHGLDYLGDWSDVSCYQCHDGPNP